MGLFLTLVVHSNFDIYVFIVYETLKNDISTNLRGSFLESAVWELDCHAHMVDDNCHPKRHIRLFYQNIRQS